MHTLIEDNIPLSATPSPSNNLAELVARKAELDTLRQELNQQQDEEGAEGAGGHGCKEYLLDWRSLYYGQTECNFYCAPSPTVPTYLPATSPWSSPSFFRQQQKTDVFAIWFLTSPKGNKRTLLANSRRAKL